MRKGYSFLFSLLFPCDLGRVDDVPPWCCLSRSPCSDLLFGNTTFSSGDAEDWKKCGAGLNNKAVITRFLVMIPLVNKNNTTTSTIFGIIVMRLLDSWFLSPNKALTRIAAHRNGWTLPTTWYHEWNRVLSSFWLYQIFGREENIDMFVARWWCQVTARMRIVWTVFLLMREDIYIYLYIISFCILPCSTGFTGYGTVPVLQWTYDILP